MGDEDQKKETETVQKKIQRSAAGDRRRKNTDALKAYFRSVCAAATCSASTRTISAMFSSDKKKFLLFKK
jgi:hypothetical protein